MAEYAGVLDSDEHLQGQDEGPDVRRNLVVWFGSIVYYSIVQPDYFAGGGIDKRLVVGIDICSSFPAHHALLLEVCTVWQESASIVEMPASS